MISLIIADDHDLFAAGVQQALDSVPDLEVLATASNGAELSELANLHGPDVVIVDLEMPEVDGLAALARIPDPARAIVVTMHADEDHRRKVLDAGAGGFLSKSTPLRDLAAAIRAVADGRSLMSVTTARTIMDEYMEPVLDPGAASLTAREKELLGFLASGVSSTEELADRMYISPKTVKNHLASIYEKLAVSDRTQAAVEAIRLGLITRSSTP